MSLKHAIGLIGLLSLVLFFIPQPTLAACPAPPAMPASIQEGIDCAKQNIAQPGGLVGGTGAEPTISALVFRVLTWFLGLIGVITLVAIIWGGFKYMTAFGDEKKTEAAKKIILGAIIGVVLIATSFMIVQIIRGFITG